MNLILQESWHWAFSGFMVAIVMLLLLLMGNHFGVSATFRALCSLGGAGRCADFFRFDWRSQLWNIAFVMGAMVGGFVAVRFMDGNYVELSEAATLYFVAQGLTANGQLLPHELFGWEQLLTLKGFLWMGMGGFLIGFGSRYAGGCTSGHAISGLSEFQLPSLVAVIGFFIGGLLITHLVLPLLF
ncbi:MAG: YeeE/YedE family protein [Bernardetiaceae bacterium]